MTPSRSMLASRCASFVPAAALVALLAQAPRALAAPDEPSEVEVRPSDPLLRGPIPVPRWLPPALGAAAALGGVAYVVHRMRRRGR